MYFFKPEDNIRFYEFGICWTYLIRLFNLYCLGCNKVSNYNLNAPWGFKSIHTFNDITMQWVHCDTCLTLLSSQVDTSTWVLQQKAVIWQKAGKAIFFQQRWNYKLRQTYQSAENIHFVIALYYKIWRNTTQLHLCEHPREFY